MISITDLVINAEATFGSPIILTEVTPIHQYENNKRLEKVVAHRYTVVLPARKYEKVGVRIDGDQLVKVPEEGCAEVVFRDLEISAYDFGGKTSVGARAKGIAMANNPKR